jgi:hypothetical protein
LTRTRRSLAHACRLCNQRNANDIPRKDETIEQNGTSPVDETALAEKWRGLVLTRPEQPAFAAQACATKSIFIDLIFCFFCIKTKESPRGSGEKIS